MQIHLCVEMRKIKELWCRQEINNFANNVFLYMVLYTKHICDYVIEMILMCSTWKLLAGKVHTNFISFSNKEKDYETNSRKIQHQFSAKALSNVICLIIYLAARRNFVLCIQGRSRHKATISILFSNKNAFKEFLKTKLHFKIHICPVRLHTHLRTTKQEGNHNPTSSIWMYTEKLSS